MLRRLRTTSVSLDMLDWAGAVAVPRALPSGALGGGATAHETGLAGQWAQDRVSNPAWTVPGCGRRQLRGSAGRTSRADRRVRFGQVDYRPGADAPDQAARSDR